MDDELTEYPKHHVDVQPCQTCGRRFNIETLSKHQAICRKVSIKTRKVFDTGKQRATDSDVPYKATQRTTQIYNGEVRAQDDRSMGKSKTIWREKHQRLIRSIREARSVTQSMKQGVPLPAFRPSEVPSDYVSCPCCHRNFNEHAAKRHIPFCQTQHERKHIQSSSKSKQQLDRGRTLPPQRLTNEDMYASPDDVYKNSYKTTKSAPMRSRRNPAEYQPLPAPPKTSNNDWRSRQRSFGANLSEQTIPATYYQTSNHEETYEPPLHRPVQQRMLMRTGRNQDNTNLNVRARQKNDDASIYMRRLAPMPSAPSSYSQTRYHHSNNQHNSTRPTTIGRPPLAPTSGNRCHDCGRTYLIPTARFCTECGSQR
ncbi:unnamed protein product [Adineta ricciae]|uniref:C2HC/C3H-type domain-containing protein n=1 Tax=Adineta ricciae TaxID=249248 RepID=A0A813Y191_ADIRI|nr:unnamed protein product [Adineta ricciae]CAF0932572.1 unnamed protein product [Adineta ricciae]